MLLQTLRCPPASAESDLMHYSKGLPGKPVHASMHASVCLAVCFWAGLPAGHHDLMSRCCCLHTAAPFCSGTESDNTAAIASALFASPLFVSLHVCQSAQLCLLLVLHCTS